GPTPRLPTSPLGQLRGPRPPGRGPRSCPHLLGKPGGPRPDGHGPPGFPHAHRAGDGGFFPWVRCAPVPATTPTTPATAGDPSWLEERRFPGPCPPHGCGRGVRVGSRE